MNLLNDPEVRAMAILGARAVLAQLTAPIEAQAVVRPAKPVKRGRRKLSPEGRAAIAAAAKRRWARFHKQKEMSARRTKGAK